MRSTRCLLLVAVALFGAAAPAAESWLTIVGEPSSPGSHYIQVNPAQIDIKGDIRMIPVRISRATTWTTEDGIQFRSAEAEVLIDCDRQMARYLNAAFYPEPDFQGQAFKVLSYGKEDMRPVAFRDIGEYLNARIIKAACSAKNVTSK
jgi:hypothetical protein